MSLFYKFNNNLNLFIIPFNLRENMNEIKQWKKMKDKEQ